MPDTTKPIKSRRNLKRVGIELVKTTIELPIRMFEGWKQNAAKHRVSMRVRLEEMIKVSAMNELEFRQIMFELSMTLPQLRDYCIQEQMREAGLI